MTKRSIILLGTSRSDGNTKKVTDIICDKHPVSVVDISKLGISYFDYEYKNQNDKFLGIAESLLNYDQIGFATPVYWYSMSSQLKVFFDRLSDLLKIRKDIGRGLAGRSTFLIATGSDTELPEGFEVPFRKTSEYFDMNYQGSFYTGIIEDLVISDEDQASAETFAQRLFGL